MDQCALGRAGEVASGPGPSSGVTLLDESARFLFGRVNQRLIQARKIPCAHPAEAVAALERNYLEMFDFTNPSQPVARWFFRAFRRAGAVDLGQLGG